MFHWSKYYVCVGWMFTRSKVLKGKYTHFSLGLLHWRSTWQVSFSINGGEGVGVLMAQILILFWFLLFCFTFDYIPTHPHFSFLFYFYLFIYLFFFPRTMAETIFYRVHFFVSRLFTACSEFAFDFSTLLRIFWTISGVFDSPLLGKVWEFCIIKQCTVISGCRLDPPLVLL